MISTIVFWCLVVFFGFLFLSLVGTIVLSLCVSGAAVLYRLIPGPNVPISYNLRNILVRWISTALTAGAFTVVVFLLVPMFALVTGMYRLTERSAHPGNVMMLQDGALDEVQSNLPPTADELRLPEDVRRQILKSGGQYLVAKEVYTIVNQPIPNAPPSGKQRRFVQMRGIDKVEFAATIHGIELQEGRWFSKEGVQPISTSSGPTTKDNETALIAMGGVALVSAAPDDRAIEVVIGEGMAKVFGAERPGGVSKCGDILDIGGRKWIVVGIMSGANSSFASEVWCRDYLVQELFGRRNSYSTYVVATADAKSAAVVAKELKQNFKELALNALPETEYYANLNATNQQFLYVFIFVALVMGIGGVAGVMTTMFAAISQRAKDIGVLRLLGYTRWQITVSLLLESLVIGLLGGVVGCAAAYFIFDGMMVTSMVGTGQGGGKTIIIRLAVDVWTIVVAMLVTLIMGSVGGVLPAVSAMRLKPLESLR